MILGFSFNKESEVGNAMSGSATRASHHFHLPGHGRRRDIASRRKTDEQLGRQ